MSQYFDQRQQQLRNAYEYNQQQIKLATERILKERGPDLEREAKVRQWELPDPQTDPAFRQEAAREMAQELAQRGVRSGNFSLDDYRDVPDLGINRAEIARDIREEELAREQVAERDANQDPEVRQTRIYADLKREHSEAVLPDVAQDPEAEPALDVAEMQQEESRPVRKYAELERAHAEALLQQGHDAKPEHERLEFAEDMDQERHMTQIKGDAEIDQPENGEKRDVEEVKSIEESLIGLFADPTGMADFDIDKLAEIGEALEKDKERSQGQLEFFEQLHQHQGPDHEL